MSIDFFLMSLLIISVFTGLVTEAVKVVCKDHHWNYSANTISGICALVVSLCISVGYILYMGVAVTVQVVIVVIALIVMSWLCAMLGYDKVMQAIEQFRKKG